MRYFSTHQRMWLIGPIGLVMYWLYVFAVTKDGKARIVFGVPFMVINFVFNVTVGSFIFWELPKEWFFTDRLKRHKRDNADNDRGNIARLMCQEMNKADPGHC